MKHLFSGYWIERRGSNYYGFCDKACKPVVRAKFHVCVAAMDRHMQEHNGQGMLPEFVPLDDSQLSF